MKTFDGCCGSCVHMNTNDYVNHKDHCYCTYRKQYYNLDDRKCSYYEYDPNKDYYDLNHRWHIVSAVLGILRESAESAGIEKLYSFRTDVLEKDARFEAALRVYDIAGPFLARQLSVDPNAETFAQVLLSAWMLPIEAMIRDGRTDEALRQYAEMVDSLLAHYADAFRAYCGRKAIAPLRMTMHV